MKREQIDKLKEIVSFVGRFANDITDTISGHEKFAQAKGIEIEQVAGAQTLEYFREKLAIMKDYVGNMLDMVESQQALDKAKSGSKQHYNQSMKNDMTVKDMVEKAASAAWEAFYTKLNEFGIAYDDTDSGAYIDDPKAQETYCFNTSTITCDEYGGED